MRRLNRTMISLASLAVLALVGVGCTDADIASKNLSKAADMFEVKPQTIIPDVDFRGDAEELAK